MMTMPRSPIDTMLDKVDWRCPRCGGKGCDCWAKNTTLRCPRCKRTKMVCREDTDPKGTAVVEHICDKCNDDSGFPETHYYDAKGRWWDGKRFKAMR